MDKRPLVVKLDEEDRARLQYVVRQTRVGAVTTLVRMLIRAASEGEFQAGSVSFSFPPFSAIGGKSDDKER